MLKDRLVAHRGYQHCYPENTLLSMAQAIEAGAHYIEMDIQFSADHQPVLYHDPIMKRVSDITAIISSLSLKELKKAPAYEPRRLGNKFINETITPLSKIVDLLTAHPDVRAFVELKSEAVDFLGVENTYRVINQVLEPVLEQCILISFHNAFIHYAIEQHFPQTGMVLEEWADLDSITHTSPDYIFCDKNIIPANTELGEFPFMLVVYEVDDAEEARQLFNAGVDIIETFDIKGLLESLGHQAI